jgi:rod shape determining protein RodA
MRLRNVLEIDFSLLLAAMILSVFGVLFIYSSGITSTGVLVSSEYIRQIIWATAGVFIALALSIVDYRRIRDLSLYFYLGTLALLLYTCLFGRLVNGARAWIGIGSFGIQPSEFAKITTILFLARYLGDTKHSAKQVSRFLISCFIVFVPMGLVLIQPDFGTSLVFIPILLVMTFIAGVSVKYVIFLSASIILTGVLMALPLWQSYILRNSLPSLMILTNSRFILIAILALGGIFGIALFGFIQYKKRYFFWIVYGVAIVAISLGASFMSHRVLKDYQIMRLIVFLDPNVDPRGAGWNIIQSITAIGSGGLTGKDTFREPRAITVFSPSKAPILFFRFLPKNGGFWGASSCSPCFCLSV